MLPLRSAHPPIPPGPGHLRSRGHLMCPWNERRESDLVHSRPALEAVAPGGYPPEGGLFNNARANATKPLGSEPNR